MTPARASEDVGGFARARASQLQACYERELRATNPSLAGALTLAVTVSGGGRVTEAAVTRRTWSGPGSAEAEACILRAVRAWTLPPASESAGTYALPLSFTR